MRHGPATLLGTDLDRFLDDVMTEDENIPHTPLTDRLHNRPTRTKRPTPLRDRLARVEAEAKDVEVRLSPRFEVPRGEA